jgi:hypothetical protein
MSDTSRRALLTALSVAPVALAPALPAIASETGKPDAQLLDLVRRCIEAMDRTDAFQAILDAAEHRFERAPLPEAMYVRASDPFPSNIHQAEWQDGDCGKPDGRLCYENESARNFFKSTRYMRADDRERVEEILSAWEGWKAENTRRWEAAGLNTANAENERLADIGHELRRELCAMPARTLPGLLAKASVVAHCFDGSGESFADYCASELEKSGANGEVVADSITRDLIALLSSSSARTAS